MSLTLVRTAVAFALAAACLESAACSGTADRAVARRLSHSVVSRASRAIGRNAPGWLADVVRGRRSTLAARSAVGPSSSHNRNLRDAYALDLKNHSTAAVRPLPHPRTVFRYTTRDRARDEAQRGIGALRHMTSVAGPGRPLGSSAAARRYGLATLPTARETIRLRPGQPVILNKVPGGSPGRGELVSPQAVAPGDIVRVVPIR